MVEEYWDTDILAYAECFTTDDKDTYEWIGFNKDEDDETKQ